ncbi:MAG TPA: integrase [Casimicrobiaceae bacterium]
MAVKQLANGRWAIEFQQHGERIFRRCPPGIRRSEAVQFEAALRRLTLTRQVLGEKPAVMLDDAVKLWLRQTEAHRRDKKKPRQNAALLAPFIGTRSLEDAPLAAQAAVQAWSGRLSPKTINRRLNVLKATCKHAWRSGLIDTNLSGKIALLPEGPGREIYLTPEQIKQLADAAPDERTAAAIMILAYSGLRWSEFARLPAIPANARVFVVGDSKTRKPRQVPIVDTIRPYLHVLPFKTPYRTFLGAFWTARTNAGMPHVRPHDLRHSCASMLIQKGVGLHVVASILGDHLLTARRYAHLADDTLAAAMAQIG